MNLKKPGTPRAIFILNALLVITSFIFYFVFYTKEAAGETDLIVDPTLILYNSLFYLASFVLMVAAIVRGNVRALRGTFLLDIMVSIVIVFAPIGLGIAAISIGLSFSRPVKEYFEHKKSLIPSRGTRLMT